MNPLSAAAWVAAFFLCANLFSHTVALRLILLLLGIGLCVWAVLKDRKSIRALPPIWIAFVLWAIWAALSITWSLDPARSAKEFQNEIVYCALAFWFCYVAAKAPDARKVMIRISAIGAFAVCAVSLYYFSKGYWAYWQGPHGGSGNHSSALLVMMPCALLLAWYAQRSDWPGMFKALPWAMLAIFLLSAYATLNRTIWLGFALHLILIGILLLKRRTALGDAPMTRRVKALAVALAIAVVAGAGAVLYHIQAARTDIVQEGGLAEDPRFALWLAIVDRVEERPLTGYGFGRGMFRGVLRKEMDNLNLWHSHNLFLDTVLQLGVPGLLLLLILLGATVREGWRLRLVHDDATAACGIAVVAVVAGMLVRNMTDVLWVRQYALLYWGLLGTLLAWGTAPQTHKS